MEKKESIIRVQEICNQSLDFRNCDLLDREGLISVFNEFPIQQVIHFAGVKAVGESCEIPLHYYRNNVGATIVLCEVMSKFLVKTLVFSSSCTVYGNPQEVPIKEDSPLCPVNPYGRSKLMAENILKDLHKSDPSWDIVCLRYFNPIGAHPSGRIGEDPRGIPNNLLPYVAQVAIGKLSQLSIFGKDYPTPDGTAVRDYIHVVDLAIGHVRAIDYLSKNPGFLALNLGTGKGFSVLEVIQAFERYRVKKFRLSSQLDVLEMQ